MATQPPLPGKLGEIQKALEVDVAEIKKIEAGTYIQYLNFYL